MMPKFKVWDKQKEKMFEQSEVIIWFDENGVGIVEDDYRADRLTDFELLQSTGLKDKNGKEIYEGDLVKLEYGMGIIREIIYKDCEFKIKTSHSERSLSRERKSGLILVGNKYEHPHLLEEE